MFFLLREGMRQSFFLTKPSVTEKSIPDQSGKVFLITGANTGVGYHVAEILYGANGKVYVAARTESKAQAAIDAIKKAYPNSRGSLHFLQLDLSDLTTIKKSADEFLAKEEKLHWLNHNAGVMVPPTGSKGAQGIELQYQTNILGPFLFNKLLMPILTKTASTEPKGSVRVSWAASGVVLQAIPKGTKWVSGKDSQNTLDESLGAWDLYSTSKVANYYLGHEFARRNPDAGIFHNSYNPGNLASDLQRHMRGFQAWAMRTLLLHPPVYGAYTELYNGLSKDVTIEKDQGAFIAPWGRKTIPRPDQAAEVAKGADGEAAKVYDWADRLTKEYQ